MPTQQKVATPEAPVVLIPTPPVTKTRVKPANNNINNQSPITKPRIPKVFKARVPNRAQSTKLIDPTNQDSNLLISEENKRILGNQTEKLKDFGFDPEGRLIPLVPEAHWKQKVNVKVSVSEKTKSESQETSAAVGTKDKKGLARVRKPKPAVSNTTNTTSNWISNLHDSYHEDASLIIPPLVVTFNKIESMKLAPGVTIKEGAMTKSVPLPKKVPETNCRKTRLIILWIR